MNILPEAVFAIRENEDRDSGSGEIRFMLGLARRENPRRQELEWFDDGNGADDGKWFLGRGMAILTLLMLKCYRRLRRNRSNIHDRYI